MKKPQNNKWQNSVKHINSLIEKLFLQFNLLTNKLDDFCNKSPYTRLIRLHKTIGVQLLIVPIFWTLALATNSFLEFSLFSLIFILGAIIIRSAGVIINDIADCKFDKNVSRTKKRPLASGELSINQAVKFLAILLLIALLILLMLPIKAIYTGIIAFILISAYPYSKRYTKYPQIFLGFTFNIGKFGGI